MNEQKMPKRCILLISIGNIDARIKKGITLYTLQGRKVAYFLSQSEQIYTITFASIYYHIMKTATYS